MRRLLFVVGMPLLLAGCITPGLQIKNTAAEAAQPLVTPAITKDCSDKVAKEFPDVKVVGSYALSPAAAARVNDRDFMWVKENLVALAAPTTNTALFGQENKGLAACSYLIEGGRLVFHKVHGPVTFLPVTIIVR
jgi:hypothetical protein